MAYLVACTTSTLNWYHPLKPLWWELKKWSTALSRHLFRWKWGLCLLQGARFPPCNPMGKHIQPYSVMAQMPPSLLSPIEFLRWVGHAAVDLIHADSRLKSSWTPHSCFHMILSAPSYLLLLFFEIKIFGVWWIRRHCTYVVRTDRHTY